MSSPRCTACPGWVIPHPTHCVGSTRYNACFTPPTPARYREAELLHARWAMLAVPGVLLPEVLAMNGVDLGEPVWWKVGCSACCIALHSRLQFHSLL